MSYSYLLCPKCGNQYEIKRMSLACARCGETLTVSYDYEAIKRTIDIETISNRQAGIWRYFELLPILKGVQTVSLGEGGTYLHRCDRLAESIGVRKLFIKNETTNPTGSFIDRGTTVAVTRAIQLGFQSVSCAPTGNLGASLAAYAAKAGLKCKIFISREVDLGKLFQMIAYGAEMRLAGDAEEALVEARRQVDRSYLVTPVDPFFLEGEKTVGFEICEQLGWRTCDRVVVPMGTGGNLSMIWKSVKELCEVGLIKGVGSMMTGVQAEGCAPIVEAFMNRRQFIQSASKPRTIALDIAVKDPMYGSAALRAIRESRGSAIAVSDEEILEATRQLAKTEGIFAEPAAASTVAGLKKLIDTGKVKRSEEIVCVITGAGLKDPGTARKIVERLKEMDRLLRRMEERRLTTKLGDTKTRILEILSSKELHGYGIWKELKQAFGLEMSIPSVYEHLAELEMLKLIRRTRTELVAGRRERHYYSLTEAGRDTVRTVSKLAET